MMETIGIASDFLGVTKAALLPSDYGGYSQFFQDDEIVLNKLDNIFFNVFDRIFYLTTFPKKLFMIAFPFIHVQALFGNTFFSRNGFYNFFVMVFLITNPIKMSPNQFYGFGYCFFGITFVIWALFIAISLIIEKQKYISSIPLTIASFLIFIVNPILLNPTTFLIKRLIILILMISSYMKSPDNPVHINFLKYYPNEDFFNFKDSITSSDRSLLILLLIFLIISFILQTVMVIFSYRLLSVTPYVPYHIFTGFSMRNIFYQLFLRLIIRLLESFFGFFPRWSTLILYVFNVILYLLLLFFIFLFPVIHSYSNACMIGYSISGILGSVLKLAYANNLEGMGYAHYASILGSYLVVSFISYLFFSLLIRKKYMPLLAFNGETNICDSPKDKNSDACKLSSKEKDEIIKRRVFEDERIQVIPYSKKIMVSFSRISSRMKLLYLIKTGVENGCDLFIDYTLFKFLISTFSDDRELLRLISIIEMGFPYMRFYFQHILPIIRVDLMKFSQRFLIYEINSLNKLTETDLSASSSKEMSIIRTNSAKYQEIVMNTWLLDKITITSLDNVMSAVNRGDKMWEYILSKYPNLMEAHRLYHQFSIECKTDFYQAAFARRQIQRIEENKLNIKDKAFISLVRTFPFYLTHHIINANGFLEVFNSSDGGKEEPENSENMSSLTEPNDYESKLRYAIFRATHKTKANSSKFMEIIIYIFFFVFIVTELSLALVYYQTFTDEMENTDILKFYRHLTANLSLTNSYVILKYATLFSKNSSSSSENVSGSSILLPKRKGHPSPVPSFEFDFYYYYDKYNMSNLFFDTSEDSLDFNIISRALLTANSYQLLFAELKALTADRFYNVNEVTNLLFNTPLELQICYKAKKMSPTYQDIPRSLVYHTMGQIKLAYSDDMSTWLTESNSFCNIFSTFSTITTALRVVRDTTYQIFMETNRAKKKEILIISLSLSISVALLYIVFFTIANLRFLKELRYFADILSSLDDDEKRKGANPILLDGNYPNTVPSKSTNNNNQNNGQNNDQSNVVDKNSLVDKNMNPIRYSSKRLFYYSMIFLCFLLIIIQGVFLFCIGFIAYQMKDYDLVVTYWNFFNKLRIPQYFEIFDSLALTTILRTHQTNATTYNEEKEHTYSLIENTETSNTYLVTSNDDGPSILGKSEIFDEYYLKNTCSYVDDDGLENIEMKRVRTYMKNVFKDTKSLNEVDPKGTHAARVNEIRTRNINEVKSNYSNESGEAKTYLNNDLDVDNKDSNKVKSDHSNNLNNHEKDSKADDPYDWIDDTSYMYTDEEFECMSMSSKILIYLQITRDALQKIERDTMTDSLNDYIVSRIAYLYYILNKYICLDINKGDSIINSMGDQYLSYSKRNIILLLIAAIVISIASFFVNLYFKSFLNSMYQGGIILVRRLNPNEMAANHRLVSFLLNKGINKKNSNKEMNVTQSIVHYSSDMLFYLNNNGIILITNQAILQNLAYSPEQIVGKPICSLFEEESKKEIQKNMAMLEKNEEKVMKQINVTCFTANQTEIMVSLIMFQTSSKHIVIIMKNLKDILEKQRILEDTRNICLNLYYSILPSFVAKLKNMEEKDISFLVPVATIMFVDIVRFSDFSRALSPEQLLSVLSSIYNQYSAKLNEYKSLTKIKIIGDIFMIAGGLFNSQGDKKNLIPTSSSGIGSVLTSIKGSKSKESPETPSNAAIAAGGNKLKRMKGVSNYGGTGSNADIKLMNPLTSSSQIKPSSTLHDLPGIMPLAINPPNPNNNNNNAENFSSQPNLLAHDYIQNGPQENMVHQSLSDVESALQNEQIIYQSSIDDFMTPEASVASQAVRFGFDTIEVIEDANMKNNFNLSVRIGISTGGPIIAGVLGDDRLDFEIFGEEISFASILQTKGVPGKVVISDSTYNLISNLQYSFEDRDIIIKGKGKYRTHVVYPDSSSMPYN